MVSEKQDRKRVRENLNDPKRKENEKSDGNPLKQKWIELKFVVEA